MSSQAPLIDTEGKRITHPELQSAMETSCWSAVFASVWLVMALGVPLTLFMEAMGASGVLIGMVTSVRFLAMMAQVPGALFSERFASRKLLWTPLALVHRSVWLLIAALAFFAHPGMDWVPVAVILLIGFSDLLGHCVVSSWLSWMTDLIPQRQAGSFWGKRTGFIMASALVAIPVSGWLMDAFRTSPTGNTSSLGFGLVFTIGAVAGLADILIHARIREPRPLLQRSGRKLVERILAPLLNRDFLLLTLALGTWFFGATMVTAFSVVYLKRDFPVSYSHIAATTIAASLGAVLTSVLFGKLIDRLGARVLCAILMLLAPLPIMAWFFVHPGLVSLTANWQVPQVIVNQVIAGFFAGSLFTGIIPCHQRLAGLLSQSDGRTVSLAVHSSIVGVFAGVGALVGGAIMDSWGQTGDSWSWTLPGGIAFSFLHVIIILFTITTWAIAVPLLLAIRTTKDSVNFGDAVSRLFSSNPITSIRSFYNLEIIAASPTVERRVRAARRLAAYRSEFAVPELIEQLDNPSISVQEEAIEALGSIGTPEAIDALLEMLCSPTCDLVPQICRALRETANAACVEPLLRQLEESRDRESLSEAARTLGRIGDRRAIPYLLNLITHHRDRKVVAASSEALAALGELSAAYQIVPQMRAASQQSLKRALSIAAGDLLGKKEAFYPLLIAESDTPGSGASVLIERLRRLVRKRFPKATAQLETLDLLETAYLEGDIPQAASLMLHLGLHIVQFIHRLPLTLDPNNAMQNLLVIDHRAALGVWYLKTCNEPWITGGIDHRDFSDILLGLHVIVSFTQPAVTPSSP